MEFVWPDLIIGSSIVFCAGRSIYNEVKCFVTERAETLLEVSRVAGPAVSDEMLLGY